METHLLSKLGISIQMISQGASQVNISIVVPSDRSKEAVAELHRCFFEESSCLDGSDDIWRFGSGADAPC